MNTFWKANYAKMEKRLCALCASGDKPELVAYIPVVEAVQVRFPRSKKKRIRKKWAKRSCNFTFARKTWRVFNKNTGVFEFYGRQNQSQSGPRNSDELGRLVSAPD